MKCSTSSEILKTVRIGSTDNLPAQKTANFRNAWSVVSYWRSFTILKNPSRSEQTLLRALSNLKSQSVHGVIEDHFSITKLRLLLKTILALVVFCLFCSLFFLVFPTQLPAYALCVFQLLLLCIPPTNFAVSTRGFLYTSQEDCISVHLQRVLKFIART